MAVSSGDSKLRCNSSATGDPAQACSSASGSSALGPALQKSVLLLGEAVQAPPLSNAREDNTFTGDFDVGGRFFDVPRAVPRPKEDGWLSLAQPALLTVLGVWLLGALGSVMLSGVPMRDIPGVIWSFLVLHVAYGLGYWQGIWRFILLRQSPEAAFKTLTR